MSCIYHRRVMFTSESCTPKVDDADVGTVQDTETVLRERERGRERRGERGREGEKERERERVSVSVRERENRRREEERKDTEGDR